MSLIKSRKDQFVNVSDYVWENSLNNDFSNTKSHRGVKTSELEFTETDSTYHYELKIPGYIKDDFNFYISRNDLIVTTEKIKKMETIENCENKFTKHTYCYASAFFKRNFHLPKNIVRDEILVDYKDEILSFDLFKSDN